MSRLNKMAKNAVSEDQGERFHKVIKTMKTLYIDHWDVTVMFDYCWYLKKVLVKIDWLLCCLLAGFRLAGENSIEESYPLPS